MHRVHFTAVRSALILLTALLIAAPVAEAQTKVKVGFNLFSATQDVEVGTASAAEVEKQLPLHELSANTQPMKLSHGGRLSRPPFYWLTVSICRWRTSRRSPSLRSATPGWSW